METSRLKVDLLGATFQIRANEDSAYLKAVLDYLREKVDEVRSAVGPADPLKIALLAALNLVDELFKERQGGLGGRPGEFAEIGRITERLIERIDRSLGE
jgi:cell division protein ZapA (FtsZ GTPase activity inhibitor)